MEYWRTGCQAFTTDFQGKHIFDKSIVLVQRLHQAVIHSLQTHKLSHIRASLFCYIMGTSCSVKAMFRTVKGFTLLCLTWAAFDSDGLDVSLLWIPPEV